MEFMRAVLILFHLWTVLAFDCPEECTCGKAELGGFIADCNQLHERQRFPNYIHHLSIKNADPNKILSFNKNIFQTVNLQQLNSLKIINSSLQSIDVEAFNFLEDLRFVDLSNNELIYIHPNTFKNNKNLNQLSLSGNPIQSAERQSSNKENFFHLSSQSLTEIDLSGCKINTISDSTFDQLPSLITVNLQGNNIKILNRNVFDKLEYVEEINLSNNMITSLDEELFSAINDLTTLNLAKNNISEFDDIEILGLRDLDLSNNNFKVLKSSTFEGVPDLRSINLSHNKIESISEGTFSNTPVIRNIDLSHNNLRGPLSELIFEAAVELETLSFAHNPELNDFSYFETYLGRLYKLDISYCGLRELKNDIFRNTDGISILNISGNKLAHIDSETFTDLAHLKELDLSNNQLTNLDDRIFSKNTELRKLYINNNKITHLSAKTFVSVPHLRILDARKCQLSYLWSVNESKYMVDNKILSELNYLNLEENRFKTLHKHNFGSMANLKTLDISKNQFQCDKQINYLIQWLMTKKITPIKYIGKSSADMENEHSKLHWGDMLSTICLQDVTDNVRNPIPPQQNQEESFDELVSPIPEADFIDKETYFTNPDMDYTPVFELRSDRVIKTSESSNNYPWLWPLFLVLVCGVSILLALFNLAALFFYRTGRNYKVAGYRSTFVSPITNHMKTKRDAGSFYHKLYEECSVPNSTPIVKNNTDLTKDSTKKTTVITSGTTTKGEDMV